MVEYFSAIYRAFEQAARHKGEIVDRFYEIAGYTIHLGFAGPALLSHFTPALEHLAISPNLTPDLDIFLWDTHSTGTRLPTPPWEVEEPQLYRNLSQQGINDPLMGKLKGIYRHTWYENQMAFHRIADVLRPLHDQGIATMLLGGVALTLLYCKDMGLRPLDSFDVLVETDMAAAAMSLLKEIGWKTKLEAPEAFVSVANSMRFTDAAGHSLQLQWRILSVDRQDSANPTIWETGVLSAVDDIPARVPNATFQLLVSCARANEWSPVPAPIVLADAMAVMRSSSDEIDWSLLLALAERQGLIQTLRSILIYLHGVLNEPAPESVLKRLEDTRVSLREGLEYRARARQRKFPERLATLWFSYLRSTGNSGMRLLGFPRYIQYVLEANSITQVPYRAFRSGFRKSGGFPTEDLVKGKSVI